MRIGYVLDVSSELDSRPLLTSSNFQTRRPISISSPAGSLRARESSEESAPSVIGYWSFSDDDDVHEAIVRILPGKESGRNSRSSRFTQKRRRIPVKYAATMTEFSQRATIVQRGSEAEVFALVERLARRHTHNAEDLPCELEISAKSM